MIIKFYKYRKGNSDSEFSMGGTCPYWANEATSAKTGKRWNKIGHLKSHLTLVRNTYNRMSKPSPSHRYSEYYTNLVNRMKDYLENGVIVEYTIENNLLSSNVVSEK